MKTILLPTDFSDNAKNAIRYAIQLFGNGDKKYILLNAYEMPYATAEVMITVDDILAKNSREDLENELAEIESWKEAEGLNIEIASKHGDIVNAIEQLSKNETIDIIVMGTQGASGLEEVLVGSNTAEVVKSVGIPVIAVPEQAKFKKPENIVFAADYNNLSHEEELDALVSVARSNNSKVKLLNILKEGGVTSAEEAFEGLKLNKLLQGLEHTFHFVESDDVVEGINAFINENEVDLLVVLERKTSFLERIFKKSVTKRLAFHTKIPMLILHDIKEE